MINYVLTEFNSVYDILPAWISILNSVVIKHNLKLNASDVCLEFRNKLLCFTVTRFFGHFSYYQLYKIRSFEHLK